MKPNKATCWAVVTPLGKVLIDTVATGRAAAIRGEAWARRPWAALKKEGYTCQRFNILPEEESE